MYNMQRSEAMTKKLLQLKPMNHPRNEKRKTRRKNPPTKMMNKTADI